MAQASPIVFTISKCIHTPEPRAYITVKYILEIKCFSDLPIQDMSRKPEAKYYFILALLKSKVLAVYAYFCVYELINKLSCIINNKCLTLQNFLRNTKICAPSAARILMRREF